MITKTDKLIYNSLYNSLLDAYSIYANDWSYPGTRNAIWYKNIVKHIFDAKIFINGFHFQIDKNSSTYSYKLKQLLGNKFISIGMCAYTIHHPQIEIYNFSAPTTDE